MPTDETDDDAVGVRAPDLSRDPDDAAKGDDARAEEREDDDEISEDDLDNDLDNG